MRNLLTECLIVFFSLFFLVECKAASTSFFAITSSDEILFSDNGGYGWEKIQSGLPEGVLPVRFYCSGNDVFLATMNCGIFKFNKNKWIELNSSEFKRPSIYDNPWKYRKISAFAVDPLDPLNMVVATKHSIYRSKDGAKTWKEMPISDIGRGNYITALSIKGDSIIAGTSFSGLFSFDGKRFKKIGKGLPENPYSPELKFTEQISSLLIDDRRIFAGFYFGKGLYGASDGRSFLPVKNDSDGDFSAVVYDIKKYGDKIFFTEKNKVFAYEVGDSSAKEIYNLPAIISTRGDIKSLAVIPREMNIPSLAFFIGNPPVKFRDERAAQRRSIYISIPALTKRLDYYIKIAEESEINSFVIDMKDDFGNVLFDSQSKTAKEIGSLRPIKNFKEVVKKLKEANIYLIARIVTFRDKKLYFAYDNKYAIKNKNTGKPWQGATHEYWVDPFSTFVQDYNIELALELEKLGFDEIQFDYIRFPADGPIHLCKFSFQQEPSFYKSEILIDFLQRANYNLKIPVSVDIYGFNSWYYFGNRIGQDMEEFSYVVDVISPMVYPSHFGQSFYKKFSTDTRPYYIVRDGALRASVMINKKVIIRPYLQAFNLLSPTWSPEYIKSQIRASQEGNCSGYSLWNAAGDYDVAKKAIKREK